MDTSAGMMISPRTVRVGPLRFQQERYHTLVVRDWMVRMTGAGWQVEHEGTTTLRVWGIGMFRRYCKARWGGERPYRSNVEVIGVAVFGSKGDGIYIQPKWDK